MLIYLHTVLYLITFIACFSYLNRVRHQQWLFIAAFAAAGAGSVGSCFDLWLDPPYTHFFHLLYRVGVTGVLLIHFGFDRRRATERRDPFERRLKT